MDYRIARWEDDENIPEKGILLIRHGPREGGSLPSREVQLTTEGKKACENMGAKWNGPIPKCIVTSPIERCKETGTLLISGGKWEINIYESTLLGHHGPFVYDKDLLNVAINDDNGGLSTLLRKHIAGEEVPGMLHRDHGSKRMLSDLFQFYKEGSLTLAISHDSIISALLAFGGCSYEPWPEPLCGAVIDFF
jgi:broad specificity phosphatase PhoE